MNENCTACGECGKAVQAEFDDEFNYGLKKRKGAYTTSAMAYPQRYVLDARIVGTPDADKAKAACKFNAIDFNMMKTGRFNLVAPIAHTGCKGKGDIHRILKKAQEREAARMQKFN